MDSHFSSTNSFSAVEAQFATTCAWFSALGAPVDRSRIEQYRRDIAEIAAHENSGTTQELSNKRGFDRLARSLMEIAQLNIIYQGLIHRDSPGLRTRLKKVTKGGNSLLEEIGTDSKNEPRNIAFELEIAAWLAQSGYQVDLEAECDIWTAVAGKEIALECKRPFSVPGIEKCIKKGRVLGLGQSFRALPIANPSVFL